MNSTSPGYVDEVSELDWQMWMDYAGDQQRFPRDPRHACSNPECAVLTEALFCSEECRELTEGPDHEIEPGEETRNTVLPCVAPLPEAPASINVRLMLHGRECQLTLRDSDEERLLERLAVVLERYPVAQASTAPPVSTGGDWCPIHNLQMKEQTKDGRTWYSHRTPEGWCKGRTGGRHG